MPKPPLRAALSEMFGNTPDYPITEQSRMIPCSPYAAAKLNAYHLLLLGNLDASRDRGHAADFVRSMWLMLQGDEPDDYLVATGREVTVRDLCHYVFDKVGLGDYSRYVQTAERYRRPYELKHLRGDASKACQLLGWKPRYTFEQLLDEMIVDIERQFYPTLGR